MTHLILLLLILGTTTGRSYGQARSEQAGDLSSFFGLSKCKANLQSGTTVCSAVLPTAVDTQRSKVGEHFLLNVDLATGRGAHTTTLDATIIEIRPAEKGRSRLRLRIDKAISEDGRQVSLQATVLAMVPQSRVIERWDYPFIIADRFPRIPEDDERLPGERKFSEDQRHTSPLDAITDLPVHCVMVCDKSAKNRSGDPCVDLLEARGIYGHKGVMLEPVDAASPSESVLSSKGGLRLSAGTLLVVEVKAVQGPK